MNRFVFDVGQGSQQEPAAYRVSGGLCRLSDVLPEVLAHTPAEPALPEFEFLNLFDTRAPVVMAAALVC